MPLLRLAVAMLPQADVAGPDAPPAFLGVAEQRRWRDLPPASRRAFAASRGLLRELLHDATGVPAAAWTVSAQPGQAPQVRAAAGDAVWHASLSHRLGWVAAAIGQAPVGVDIEVDRPPRSDPAERAALMLAPAELAEWRARPVDSREAALLARWTLKEAWFKACPPQSAPWDFRRVRARSCAPADANVRTWRAAPVHVALCCAAPRALAAVRCDGLPAPADDAFWRVAADHEDLT